MRSNGKYVALGLAVVTLAYGLFQARTLIQGPELTVTYPTPGQTVSGPTFEVRGEAHNISRVRINGRPITTDLTGAFKEVLVTPNGYSIILVEADNRLERHSALRVEIVGKPTDGVESDLQKTETGATSTDIQN